MGGDYLDLPVLERERLVFFIVQIELAHSEKQLVWVDAEKKGVQFFWVDRPRTHLSTQWAAVMAQFSLSRAAPHLCRNVAGNKEFSFEVKQAKHPGHLSSTGEETPATATRRTWHPLRSQSCHV